MRQAVIACSSRMLCTHSMIPARSEPVQRLRYLPHHIPHCQAETTADATDGKQRLLICLNKTCKRQGSAQVLHAMLYATVALKQKTLVDHAGICHRWLSLRKISVQALKSLRSHAQAAKVCEHLVSQAG